MIEAKLYLEKIKVDQPGSNDTIVVIMRLFGEIPNEDMPTLLRLLDGFVQVTITACKK